MSVFERRKKEKKKKERRKEMEIYFKRELRD